MRILVLGAAGMLGHAMLRVLGEHVDWDVSGTIRPEEPRDLFPEALRERLITVDDLERLDQLETLLEKTQPQVVVNCTALKERADPDPLKSISIYSVLPNRLAHLCEQRDIRLIQISSDGVFSGTRGGYTENDVPDAIDLYGISKLLGEISAPHAVTIRTSIIGHGLGTSNGLLDWFLAQEDECRCYTRAVFSGLPTVVLAGIVRDVVIPLPHLQGIYHIAAEPISKFELLEIVSEQYGKSIVMVPDETVVIDRSLVADLFRDETGYEPPGWPELVSIMHSYHTGQTRV